MNESSVSGSAIGSILAALQVNACLKGEAQNHFLFCCSVPQVDINAVVVDFSVKAPGVMCWFYAANIAGRACVSVARPAEALFETEEWLIEKQGC